jgi:hypothetical protein
VSNLMVETWVHISSDFVRISHILEECGGTYIV